MTIAVIRSLLETALKAVDTTIATAWENITFKPTDGTPYQQVFLLLADPQNPSYGGPSVLTRELGIFQVTLQYPQGAGYKDAYAKADALRTAFPRGKSFTSGSVTVIVSRTPTISPGRVDGDRWSVPVKISFFANTFG